MSLGTKELRKRANWQKVSGRKAMKAEDDFGMAFYMAGANLLYPKKLKAEAKKTFKKQYRKLNAMQKEQCKKKVRDETKQGNGKLAQFDVRPKPDDFKSLYQKVPLSKKVKKEIYNPQSIVKAAEWGIAPDYAIDNNKTGKTLYVENKRQNGWVEGKKPSAGRGNAHERSCKLFTPGLLDIMEKTGKISNALPFWVVFMGDITRDPKRVREITYWFGGYIAHFYMWKGKKRKGKLLIDHFNKNLKHLLD